MLHASLLGVDADDPRWALRYTPLAHDAVSTVAARLARAPALEGLLRAGATAWALAEPLPLRAAEVDAHLDALRGR